MRLARQHWHEPPLPLITMRCKVMHQKTEAQALAPSTRRTPSAVSPSTATGEYDSCSTTISASSGSLWPRCPLPQAQPTK